MPLPRKPICIYDESDPTIKSNVSSLTAYRAKKGKSIVNAAKIQGLPHYKIILSDGKDIMDGLIKLGVPKATAVNTATKEISRAYGVDLQIALDSMVQTEQLELPLT